MNRAMGGPVREHNQEAQGLQRHHEGQIGVAGGPDDRDGIDAARTGREISCHRIDPGGLDEHEGEDAADPMMAKIRQQDLEAARATHE